MCMNLLKLNLLTHALKKLHSTMNTEGVYLTT